MANATTTPANARRGELVAVLELDLALKEAVPADERELAVQRLLARAFDLPRGPWDPKKHTAADSLGFLVLDGLLTRDVEIAKTRARELLGPGDLLRPWDDDTNLSAVSSRVTWTILEPTRLAFLDRRWMLLAGRWPDLGSEFLSRVLRRSRWLAVLLAIAGLRGVEERVMLFLWHLASSWGRVTPAGTLVPFSLTHEVIADVIGTRRPSVTTAISVLEERGDLDRVESGWLLRADPPTSGA